MNTHATARARAPKWSYASRGFTLIELMVALTGSLFFTIFVFMLSRDVSRFFQSQARTSDTTLTALTGFERLRADIARAGFLSSPNLTRDANRCPRSVSGGPAVAPQQVSTQFASFPGLQQMALLNITASPSALTTNNFYATLNNGKMSPDVLTLYGNYASAEQFPVRAVDFTSNPVSIILEPLSPAMLRVGIDATTADATATTTLSRIFKTGTLLRVVDETNREQYALTAGVTVNSGVATLTIANTISLIQRSSSNLCGIRAHAAGLAVNPVNIIRYAITDVRTSLATNHPQLSYLYDGAAPPYENTRFDLVRYEVPPTIGAGTDLTGVNWPGTSTKVTSLGELVAEYAVDMKFGLTVLSDYQTGALTTILETASRANYADVPTNTATAGNLVATTATRGPHFIRGVHARLVVRYREADRETSILSDPTASGVTAEQLLRVKVNNSPVQFARTRSLRGHVTTRNTQNLLWN